MQAIRSLALVSSDPDSMERGAQEIFERLQQELKALGLQEEVAVTMVGDVGRHDALPLVIVYPEAVIRLSAYSAVCHSIAPGWSTGSSKSSAGIHPG